LRETYQIIAFDPNTKQRIKEGDELSVPYDDKPSRFFKQWFSKLETYWYDHSIVEPEMSEEDLMKKLPPVRTWMNVGNVRQFDKYHAKKRQAVPHGHLDKNEIYHCQIMCQKARVYVDSRRGKPPQRRTSTKWATDRTQKCPCLVKFSLVETHKDAMGAHFRKWKIDKLQLEHISQACFHQDAKAPHDGLSMLKQSQQVLDGEKALIPEEVLKMAAMHEDVLKSQEEQDQLKEELQKDEALRLHQLHSMHDDPLKPPDV